MQHTFPSLHGPFAFPPRMLHAADKRQTPLWWLLPVHTSFEDRVSRPFRVFDPRRFGEALLDGEGPDLYMFGFPLEKRLLPFPLKMFKCRQAGMS